MKEKSSSIVDENEMNLPIAINDFLLQSSFRAKFDVCSSGENWKLSATFSHFSPRISQTKETFLLSFATITFVAIGDINSSYSRRSLFAIGTYSS